MPYKDIELRRANKRKHYQKHVEYQREYHKNYTVTTEKRREYDARRDKDRIAVRVATSHAIRAGKLVRPEICDNCGNTGIIEAHHDDYSKPLQVRWLCKMCHGKARHENEHQ